MIPLRHCAVRAALALPLLALPAFAAGPKTVAVDCAKGQSIQAALAKPGNPLTIQIAGICVENVTVRRDNVTFVGSDPALDGVQAASAAEPFSAAVIVREARNIHFQNLQFSGGNTGGLRVENTRRNISADNCLFHNNGTWGVIAVGGSLEVTNSTVRDNHTSGQGGGLAVAETGILTCSGCTVVDNPDASDGSGVFARTGGLAFIDNSTIDGVQSGLLATQSGEITLASSSLSAGSSAVLASGNAAVLTDTVTLDGRISLTNKSRALLFDTFQSSTPSPNFVNNDSHVELLGSAPGATTLADDLVLQGFSEGQSIGFVVLPDLLCSGGSDLECDGVETKTSSTCGLCP